MALATVVTTFDLADYFGVDFEVRRTKAWATTNAPDATIHDTSTGETRIGSSYATIAADGTGSFSHWAPGATANPATWQTYYHFDVPDRTAPTGRRTLTLGPFTVTASGELTALVTEQIATPAATAADYASAAGTSATNASTSETNAAASATAAQTARTGAEAARDAAVDISNISTSDAVVEALIKNTGGAGPLTSAALAASYVGVLRANFDGTDETATLQAAITAAAGGTLVVPRGKTIKSGKITVPAAGVTLVGEGRSSVIDYIDDGTAGACLLEALDGSGLAVENIRLLSSNAASRSSLYGLIRTRGWDGLHIRRVWFGKSPSVAVWMSTTTNFTIDDIDIQDTYADGVHISRGSKHGTVSKVRGRNVGDDLVAVNAYTNDGATAYDNCEDITITDVKGQNIAVGRGVAINGGKHISVDDITIDGVAQAAVLVSKVTGETYDPEDITVDRVVGLNTGQDVPVGGTSGALYVAHALSGRIGRNITGTMTIDSTAVVNRADRPTGDELAAGAETMAPLAAKDDITMSTGVLRMTYFTAPRTEQVSTAYVYSTTTPAAPTPTLGRIGLYKREANGDLTLVASTANDTTLLSVGNSEYAQALSAAYTLQAGQRYALGLLIVTAATAPTVLGSGSATRPNSTLLARSPRKTAVRTGLTDLPASITVGTLAPTTSAIYAAVI